MRFALTPGAGGKLPGGPFCAVHAAYRMMVQTLIIAFYVIIVDTSLKGYWPEMSTALARTSA